MRILHACFGAGRASEVAWGLGRAQAARLAPGGRVLVVGTVPAEERAGLDARARTSSFRVALSAPSPPSDPHALDQATGAGRASLPDEAASAGHASVERDAAGTGHGSVQRDAAGVGHASVERDAAGGGRASPSEPPSIEVAILDEGALRSAWIVLPAGLRGPAAWSVATDVALCVGPALLGGRPDVLHAHGHAAGLLPLRARRQGTAAGRRALGAARVVVSVGSLQAPHSIDKRWVEPLGLAWEEFRVDGFEWHDQLSLLKAAVAFADLVLFEGPQAAAHARTEEGGAGLHGFFAAQGARVHGVTMGWRAPSAADARRSPAARAALLARVGLLERGALLAVLPGPLSWASGADTVLFVAGRLAAAGVQLAIVGRGSDELERRVRALVGGAGESVGALLDDDPALLADALRGADVCLLPHRVVDSTAPLGRALGAGALPVATSLGAHRDVLDLLASRPTTPAPKGAPPPAPLAAPHDPGPRPPAFPFAPHGPEPLLPAFPFAPHGPEPLLAAVAAAVAARADSPAWAARVAAAQASRASFDPSAAATLRLYRQRLE